MSFGDGGGGGCGAEFHGRDVGFKPEFKGGGALFGFKENMLCGTYRRFLHVLRVDLVHEA